MTPRGEVRRAQRVVTRLCGYCGHAFEPVRPHQRFCRPSCRWGAFKRRRVLPLFDDDVSRAPFE